MSNDITRDGVVFNDLFGKQVVARFDQPDSSSDGGALLLKACDERLCLTQALSDCLIDSRQPGKVVHELRDLIRQRVYGLACGYEDCNDAARLKTDPIHKMLIDRDPVDGLDLASQATLSRFENSVSTTQLMRMGNALADRVIKHHKKRLGKRAKRITVELDPTDDQTHGGQQLSFFNGFYRGYCYLPMAGFVQFNDEPDQHLFAYVLRGGNAGPARGALGILDRILTRLAASFPKARVLVRLDAGFAGPALFNLLEAHGVGYVVAMAKNAVLSGHAEPWLKPLRRLSKQTEQSHKDYRECDYKARSWRQARRVIFKAEVLAYEGRATKDNARFVVTNLKQSPKWVYERIYCARANIENRIKELKLDLLIGRTSCNSFKANQFRVLLAASAYALFQLLRAKSRGTDLHNAQVHTLRERLIKLGVWVTRSARRIVLHLPDSAPWRDEWQRIARSLGAVPG